MLNIRNYHTDDYEALKALYLQSNLYGGQFDEARDSKEKLLKVITNDPQSILVCEDKNKVVGTISLIENGRVAWLFRFAVAKSEREMEIIKRLYEEACSILVSRGHTEVLVYSPENDARLTQRYLDLGMNKGGVYTCFWQKIPY